MTLPVEIFDVIIDHLHPDKAALSACSLVCREWFPSSRLHLFGDISLRRGTARGFVQLLELPLCTFTAYVRRVNIEGRPFVGLSAALDWLDDVIPRLTPLSGVQSLCIRDLSWSDLSAHTKGSFFFTFRRIRQLDVKEVDFRQMAQLVELMCAFATMESVAVDDVGWDDPSFLSLEKRLPSTVHSLHLGHCYKRDLLQWLLAHNPVPALRNVDLGAVQHNDAQAIGDYLRAIGTSLKSLKFGFSALDAGGDAEEFYSCVDLACNTELHSVGIADFINYSQYSLTSAVPWIVDILSQITSPYIGEIVFGVILYSVDDLDPPDQPIDWGALDLLFMKPQFQSLHTLRFIVGGPIAITAAEFSLRRRLPLCQERGTLCFSDVTQQASW